MDNKQNIQANFNKQEHLQASYFEKMQQQVFDKIQANQPDEKLNFPKPLENIHFTIPDNYFAASRSKIAMQVSQKSAKRSWSKYAVAACFVALISLFALKFTQKKEIDYLAKMEHISDEELKDFVTENMSEYELTSLYDGYGDKQVIESSLEELNEQELNEFL